MSLHRRQIIQGSAGALLLAGLGRSAWAQGLDTTKVIVGFAPGGTIDLAARRIAAKLEPSFARSAVVENRTGAGGQIAVQAVKNAAPDGSMLLLTPTSPLSLHLYTYRKLSYDPAEDLAPVSGAVSFDYALAVGPLVPASVRTVRDFMGWAKANPTEANFGTAGTGSAAHFIGGGIARAAKADLKHIPYRGSQPALADMVGGQLAAVVGPTGEFMSQVRGGKVRLLGTSGPRRGRFTPDTPTVAEQGFREVAYTGWFGIYAPAKTPADVVQRLNASVRSALESREVVDALAASFMEPMHTSPQQLAALLKTETQFWAGLVKTVGFTPEA